MTGWFFLEQGVGGDIWCGAESGSISGPHWWPPAGSLPHPAHGRLSPGSSSEETLVQITVGISNFSKFRKELLQMASFYPILFSFSFSLFIKCANKVTFWLEFGCNSFQDRKYPFTTAGRKTDTIFELFRVFLHACHTVNNHLIAFKFSEWFVQCPCMDSPFWGKIVLIYLYCSSFYTCSCSSTLVKIFEKSPKRHTVKTNFFLF